MAPVRLYAFAFLSLLCAAWASACGSSSVTNVTAPDETRCAASVTADTVNVVPDGGTVTVTISAERECTWSARSDASWLLVRTTSGQGNDTVAATVSRNEQPVSRSAVLTVNDQRLTISQQPRPCDLSLQGFSNTMPFAGGTGTVRVTTIAGCSWTATSSAPWLLVRTPAGSGTGDVRFDVLANDGPAREATITVAGQTTVISQAAVVTAPVCSYTIGSQSQAFPASGGTGSVAVSTLAECAWTVTGGTDWVTILTPSGTGSGEARYQVGANTTTQARQTTLTIAGRVHTVTQPGLTCTYAVSPASASFPASGGTSSLQMNTLGGCNWTASSNAGWIVVGTSNGNGTGQISYQVLANTLTTQRTGTITAGGQTHTITQAAAAAPCTYGLAPPSRAFEAAGGSGTVTVNTPGNHCSWTAVSNAAWITVADGSAGGSGTSQISYTVASHTSTTPRTGTITVGGQTHTVTQAGAAPCSYAIDPTSASYAAEGGQGSVTLATGASCAWTATSSAPWITVATGSGTGPAGVGYTVAANTGSTQRSGTVTIGGQAHTVTQAGAPVPCTYSINPTSANYAAAGGQGTVTLATGASCAWAATSPAPWISVTSGSGTGPAGVGYTVAANTSTMPRSGTVTIGGQAHTVTQAGAPVPCGYAINPVSASYAAAGGQGTVALTTAGESCAWTATSSVPWITVTTPSGTGPASVGYAVAANTATTSRSGTVTIGGQPHTVTQAGAPVACTYAINPTSASYASAGGQGTVTLTTGATCFWTATSSATWITVANGSGTGPAGVGYTVAANTSVTQRAGTVTIAGQVHTVTQAGAPPPCAYTLNPVSATFAASGGAGTVAVETGSTCAWTAVSSAPWITVGNPGAGTGPGAFSYTVAAHTATTPRTGTITVAGQTHTITQAGALVCTYSLSPAMANIPAGGSQRNLSISTQAGCAWTATSTVAWVTLTPGPSSGTGPLSISYAVAANTGPARVGAIQVADQTQPIMQAAGGP